jgi:hypothetical protein
MNSVGSVHKTKSFYTLSVAIYGLFMMRPDENTYRYTDDKDTKDKY